MKAHRSGERRTDRAGGAGRGDGAGGADPRAAAPPWTREDALVTIGVVAADLIGYGMARQSGDWPATAGGMLLLVASALPLLVRRRYPVVVFAVVMAFEAVLRVGVPVAPGLNTSLVVALFTVVRAGRRAVTVAVSLATVALALLGPVGGLPLAWSALGYTTSTVLVVTAALLVNRWQREVDVNRRLLADRAVAEERRRIARELHDIVAHHITVMQLMAGGARANLAHAPDAAREALVTLEDSGRLALSEMRQLLDVLRADDPPQDARRNPPGASARADAPEAPQPGAEDLERLVAESRQAGLPTELSVGGEPYPLPPTVGLTVFRLVQEGLTNARKHAGDARASVRLAYHPDRITVEVRDDGAGAPGSAGTPPAERPGRPGRPGSGYGLIGMRERVALQGGTLEAGTLDEGGFRVAADLPVERDASGAPVREEARR
ncbi:sensor histidine kinase [Streptomyces sp. NPDC006529]|uniref:sensor histidine kinase n=1 Tax=Streptomyces sp. NPDC006529 TaxID=3157177 RepID=UPI0033B7CEF7